MPTHPVATTQPHQPDLIEPTPAIATTVLTTEPESPRKAYYRIEVFYLPGSGYRIEKSSGAAGAKPNTEQYWRPNLKLALEKKDKLIKFKTSKKKGRIYRVATKLEVTITGGRCEQYEGD